jgi:DNA-binding NarL/FixJ family response regulator
VTENNNLSEREIETLKLVAQGMSNKQIALSLFISINTVKVHLRNIFEKINVESRTEATLYAIEHGIIP